MRCKSWKHFNSSYNFTSCLYLIDFRFSLVSFRTESGPESNKHSSQFMTQGDIHQHTEQKLTITDAENQITYTRKKGSFFSFRENFLSLWKANLKTVAGNSVYSNGYFLLFSQLKPLVTQLLLFLCFISYFNKCSAGLVEGILILILHYRAERKSYKQKGWNTDYMLSNYERRECIYWIISRNVATN